MAEPRLRRPLEEVLNRLRNAGLPSGVGGRPWSPDFLDLPSAVPDGASFIAGSFTNHAGTRDYKLYVPSCYRGQALPLVVMLHGCTQDLDDFAAGTRMNAAAEDYSSFVVYPAQASSANCSRCWNWFSVADQQRHRGEPSIIAGITQHIMSTYSVDQERVFVAGFSAGGAMAAVMAMTYPDLYAAVGIHSGLAYEVANDLPSAFAAMRQGGATPRRNDLPKAGRSNRVVPAIVFHGDGDATVHPLNGEQVIAQWRSIMAETGAPPRTAVHRGQVPGGHAYTRTLSTDNGGAAVLEHWLIHGAGHAWSGGSPSGSYADPKGPDAAREMLRFFLEHPARFPVKPH
jgi:poly(hydroxyalkanoate) depolymerase family esterase